MPRNHIDMLYKVYVPILTFPYPNSPNSPYFLSKYGELSVERINTRKRNGKRTFDLVMEFSVKNPYTGEGVGYTIRLSGNLEKFLKQFDSIDDDLKRRVFSKELEDMYSEILVYFKKMVARNLPDITLNEDLLKILGIDENSLVGNPNYKEVIAEGIIKNELMPHVKIIDAIYKKVSTKYEKIKKELELLERTYNVFKEYFENNNDDKKKVDRIEGTMRYIRKELNLPAREIPYKTLRSLLNKVGRNNPSNKKSQYIYRVSKKELEDLYKHEKERLENEILNVKKLFLGYIVLFAYNHELFFLANPKDDYIKREVDKESLKEALGKKVYKRGGELSVRDLLYASKKVGKELESDLESIVEKSRRVKILKSDEEKIKKVLGRFLDAWIFLFAPWEMTDAYLKVSEEIAKGNWNWEKNWYDILGKIKEDNILGSIRNFRNADVYGIETAELLQKLFNDKDIFSKFLEKAVISPIDTSGIFRNVKEQFPLNVPQNVPAPQPPVQPV